MRGRRLLPILVLLLAFQPAAGLISPPGTAVMLDGTRSALRRGAATLYPVRIDRRAVENSTRLGTLRLPSTGTAPVSARFVRIERHPDGNWTWIGKVDSASGEQSVVLTFGDHATFGVIPQKSGPALSIDTRHGKSWLVEGETPRQASLPARSDALIPPRRPATGTGKAVAAPAQAKATGSARPMIDVLVAYTPSLVSFYGSPSAAQTRIAFMESLANQAYVDSQANVRIRVVAKLLLDDPIPDNWNLIYLITEPSTEPVKVKIDQWRRRYGADLVSVVRGIEAIRDNGSYGWVNGYHGNAFDPVNGFSVIGDEGPGVAGADFVFAHELGHNAGCHHEDGGDGEYGAYVFSRGYRGVSDSDQGFGTIMATRLPSQVRLGLFSNPRLTNCMGRPCGVAGFSDNARSLTTAAPAVGAMIASASRTSDLDGDGRSDVLWRNSQTGSNVLWRGASPASGQYLTRVADFSWKVVGKGDFDGDGRADVLWRNSSNGSNVIWNGGHSATATAVAGVTDLAWQVAGVGDFDHDGRADILWRNMATGTNAIWLSANRATQRAVVGVSNLDWRAAGIGDFNGDGSADIFWRNRSTGINTIWLSADHATHQSVLGVTNQSWQVAGIGDFDGDGQSDLFWRNADTGVNTIWKSGNAATQQAIAQVANQAWQPASVGDFDGDGRSDLFWRNRANGSNAIWPAADSAATRPLDGINLDWNVQP